MKETLELRMYSLVMYNLSGIQKGIQAYHASIRYALQHFNDEDFQQWAKHDQTVILLAGGGSGDMILNCEEMKTLGIKFVQFHEPDLNFSLSAVSFLLDERVFNKEKYPNFREWIEITYPTSRVSDLQGNQEIKDKWIESLGGEENRKKREFISKFRLA